jgi:hypothetical protein
MVACKILIDDGKKMKLGFSIERESHDGEKEK